jgi:hypothetical protein
MRQIRASYSQHGDWVVALNFIESGERAAPDDLPKIKNLVLNSEVLGLGIRSFVGLGTTMLRKQYAIDVKRKVVRSPSIDE